MLLRDPLRRPLQTKLQQSPRRNREEEVQRKGLVPQIAAVFQPADEDFPREDYLLVYGRGYDKELVFIQGGRAC